MRAEEGVALLHARPTMIGALAVGRGRVELRVVYPVYIDAVAGILDQFLRTYDELAISK